MIRWRTRTPTIPFRILFFLFFFLVPVDRKENLDEVLLASSPLFRPLLPFFTGSPAERERKKKRGGIFPPFFLLKAPGPDQQQQRTFGLFFSIYFLLGSDKGKLNERGPSNLNRWTLFFPFEPFNP